jgi:hypothetical protein
MSSELNYSYDPASDIRALLNPGESLRWSGSPKKGFVFRKIDLFVIPFSLIWFGFACFWEWIAFKQGALFNQIFGSFFVIIGFMVAIGRFFLDIWQRAGTTYGISDSRIIIVKQSFFSKSNQSIDLKNIADISFTQKADESGTIKFGNNIVMTSSKVSLPPIDAIIASSGSFEMIPHVKNVYDILVQLRDKKNGVG